MHFTEHFSTGSTSGSGQGPTLDSTLGNRQALGVDGEWSIARLSMAVETETELTR
jgi:hypothetical protein